MAGRDIALDYIPKLPVFAPALPFGVHPCFRGLKLTSAHLMLLLQHLIFNIPIQTPGVTVFVSIKFSPCDNIVTRMTSASIRPPKQG